MLGKAAMRSIRKRDMPGQIHRGLTCRGAATPQDHVLIGAHGCLDNRHPIPDAAALDARAPITRPTGNDDGASDCGAIIQLQDDGRLCWWTVQR